VQNLFQSEVPEIYDGTVTIRAIAREAGERTKIAVMSRDKDVDPVGACVGMKGMRVQSIIRELRGEKIDIIEFSEEITTFAEKALQPAKVSRVSITDLNDKQIEVIVDDTQLSLAIGKKGQNVRLAAKLLQWKIDIKSEEEKRQEVEQQMQAMSGGPTTPIEQVSELGETILEKLIAAGITTVEALADMTPEQLEEVPGIGEKTVEKISVAVRHYFGQYEEGEERPAVAVLAAAEDTGDVAMDKTPEAILAEEAGIGRAEEVRNLSAEDIAAAEDEISSSDAFSDADAREERIELENDAVDSLVNESQEISDEGIDSDGHDRG
jgi:N utilization substance protein A